MNAQAMTRRTAAHDYTQAGIYHITMHVADGLGQPLSHLVGSEIAPADSPDAPRTELTAIGQMMEQELLQECGPHQATGEVLTAIESRLLLTNGIITCDSYGDRALLSRRLLPVVCHRRDRALLARQKARCLEEAAQGTVLVSARIAKGEQEIIDDCMNHGFPVILIVDNGFPDRYHPSMARTDLVSTSRLLLVTPWQYHYRGKNELVTVPFCKAMNCVAQALCRTKDDWWKTTN